MSKTNSHSEYKGTRKRTYVLLIKTALDLFERGDAFCF